MRCYFCGGNPRKEKLIISFKSYYCPFCGENMGTIRQRSRKKKKVARRKGKYE